MSVIIKDGVEFREFEDGVYVSECGDVISLHYLAIGDNGLGYKHFSVHRAGTSTRYYVHRAVAELFHENLEGHPQVDHIDGNRSNNWASNLQWISHLENTRKAFSREVCMVSPEGIKYVFNNVRSFAEEHGLDSSSVSKVLKGKMRHTKNWTLGGV